MKILFKLTSRSRPRQFFEALNSIIDNVSEGCQYAIICALDSDDPSATDYMSVVSKYNTDNAFAFFGRSKNKIDAINRNIDSSTKWDILVNVSDDNRFIKKGFDLDIINAFDNLDQCLHFPDQNQGTNCMTMSIIGRTYYERDGWIYNPAFESLWCDVVAQEVAQFRSCYKYVPVNMFHHLHPSFGQGHYDEQYRRTEGIDVRTRDYKTYLRLKKEYDPLMLYPIRSI